jgi:hypothetical protein
MNVHSIHRAACGLLLALNLSSPPDAAPSFVEEQSAYVWTGVRGNIGRAPRVDVEHTSYGSDGPSVTRRARPDEHANGLRAELAELRLAEATGGPSPQHESARLELWIRACDDQPFAGQGDLLVDLALERAESLAARGETQAALAATQELLVPARLAGQAGEFELREADAAWLARATAWLADTRLVALRAKLARPQDTPRVSQDLEAVIREKLATDNGTSVLQFGPRAFAVVADYIDSKSGDFPVRSDQDPLTILFTLDEERGARFAMERLDTAGDVFPLRVLRSMRAALVLTNAGTWRFVDKQEQGRNYRDAELLQPIWRELLERLAARSDTGPESFEDVGVLVDMDALSPGLCSSLESAIRGEDAVTSQKALAALENAGLRSTARDLLVRLLDHARPEVRSFAAQRVALFDECRELWRLAGDPSPEVRLEVLGGLSPGLGKVLSIGGIQNFKVFETRQATFRDLDRGGMAVLEALARDSEPEIYLGALEILRNNSALLASRETLRELARHDDPRVRSVLPRVIVEGVPDPGVLEVLASDSNIEVLGALDRALNDLSASGPLPTPERPLPQGHRVMLGVSTAWSDEFLPALLGRLENPVDSFSNLIGAVSIASHAPEGARALTELGTSTASDEFAKSIVDVFSTDRPWAGVSPWHLIDPAAARSLLARAWRSLPQANQIPPTADKLFSGPAAYRVAGAEWLADATLPWSLRYLGAYVSAPDGDDAWRVKLLSLLAEGPAATGALSEGYGDSLSQLARYVPGGEPAGRLIAGVASRSDVPESYAMPLVEALAEKAALASPEAERVIERWNSDAPRFRMTLRRAISSLEATEEQPKLALFESVLTANVYQFEAALNAMGHLHLRAHLPLLERALLGEFASNEDLRGRQQRAAAAALACYLDEEAAEILLRGVGMTTDPKVREACFAALDTIRRYQDERARWNSRSDAGRARAEAIAELVGLIDTGEAAQKVEAVRALGTLEALEELPRLVRLAGSKDASLAKAAKEALERIHAAGKQD